MTDSIATPRPNWWSLSSLLLGTASLLLSFIAYVPFIPFLSLMSFPLGLCAMVTGWVGRRQAAADLRAQSQARWGIRLGCLAWILETLAGLATVAILTGVLALAIAALFHSQSKP